jgi:hypothetical protein
MANPMTAQTSQIGSGLMTAADSLPDTARAAAWRALWDHLVLEASRELDPNPSDEPVENDGSHDEVAA